MRVIEISCLEVWREISNYVDDAVEPELRARMDAPYTFLVASVIILLVGPGKFALDFALRRFLGDPLSQQTPAMPG